MPSVELLAWQWVCSVKPHAQTLGLVVHGDWQGKRLVSSHFSLCITPSTIWRRLYQLLFYSHCLLRFSGNTNSIFALDYISGALTLNGPLDRENPFYSAGFILTVKVRPPPSEQHTCRAGQGGQSAWGQLLQGRGPALGQLDPVGI